MNKKDLAIGVFKHPAIQEIIESKVFETSVVNQMIVEEIEVQGLLEWWNGIDKETKEELIEIGKRPGNDLHQNTTLGKIEKYLAIKYTKEHRDWAVRQIKILEKIFSSLKEKAAKEKAEKEKAAKEKPSEEPKPEKPSEEPASEKPSEESEELPDEFKKEIAAKFEALKQPRERFTKFFLRVPFLYQQQELLMKLLNALDEIQKDTVALSRQEIKEEKEVKLDNKMTRRLRSDLRYVESKIRSINTRLTNFIENIGTTRTAPEEKKALVEDIIDLQKYISEVYDYSFDIGKTLKEQDEGLSRDQIIDIVEDIYDEVNTILKSIDLEMAEGQDFRKVNTFIDQIRDNVEKIKPFFPKTAKFQPTAEKGSKEALQDFQKAITAFRADYLIDTYNDLKDGITSERQLATIQSALYNLSEKIEKLLGVASKISKKEMEVPSDMESLTDTPDPSLEDVIPVEVEEVPEEPTEEPEERVPTRFETEMEAEEEFRRLDQRQKTSVLNFMNAYSDVMNTIQEQSVTYKKAYRETLKKLAKSLKIEPRTLISIFKKMGKESGKDFMETIILKPKIKSSIVKVLKDLEETEEKSSNRVRSRYGRRSRFEEQLNSKLEPIIEQMLRGKNG